MDIKINTFVRCVWWIFYFWGQKTIKEYMIQSKSFDTPIRDKKKNTKSDHIEFPNTYRKKVCNLSVIYIATKCKRIIIMWSTVLRSSIYHLICPKRKFQHNIKRCIIIKEYQHNYVVIWKYIAINTHI